MGGQTRDPRAPRKVPTRASERGVTLLEMMVTVGLMSVIIGGIVLFLATHSRMSAGAFDRSDIQRSGRGALTVLEEKIGKAGMGLPKILAIKTYNPTDTSTNACANSPRFGVASLNYQRQWTVASTTGDTATGTVTLATITDGPPRNPTPGGVTDPDGTGGVDIDLEVGQWLFIYTTASQDLGGTFGANRGHGMVMVGAARAAGATDIAISSSPSGTLYSGAQLDLDLNATSELNNTSGRGSVMITADVAAFGMDCENPDHPYLYWDNNGSKVPVASNVATPVAGGVTGLSFRFLLDTTGPDGVPDGIGDAWDATPAALTIDPDPATAEHDNVTAVEVTLVLRSDTPDPQLDDFRTETFTLLIQTPNIHTRVDVGDTSELGRYFFVENTGI